MLCEVYFHPNGIRMFLRCPLKPCLALLPNGFHAWTAGAQPLNTPLCKASSGTAWSPDGSTPPDSHGSRSAICNAFLPELVKRYPRTAPLRKQAPIRCKPSNTFFLVAQYFFGVNNFFVLIIVLSMQFLCLRHTGQWNTTGKKGGSLFRVTNPSRTLNFVAPQ